MRLLTAFCAGVIGLSVLGGTAAAATTGTIAGKVVDGVTGQPVPGVRLILTSGSSDGEGGVVERARSDAQGRYRFDNLETGEDRYYALDARYRGGLFAGRPVTLPSDTERRPMIRSTLRVWPTTTEPDSIVVKRNDQFVIPGRDGLSVIESVTVINRSTSAYIGRGAEMAGESATGATVAFALPSGAEAIQILDSDLDMPGLVPTDTGFAATVAFPPGETTTTFTYSLPGQQETIDLSKPALYPVEEMSIFAASPLEIRSNRLEPDGEKTLEGRTYSKWTSAAPLDAGDPLQAIAVAQSSASPVPVIIAFGTGLFLLVGGLFLSRRKKGGRSGEPTAPPSPAAQTDGERARLIEEVARLDHEHESGTVPEPQWRAQRAGLLDRLQSLEMTDAR